MSCPAEGALTYPFCDLEIHATALPGGLPRLEIGRYPVGPAAGLTLRCIRTYPADCSRQTADQVQHAKSRPFSSYCTAIPRTHSHRQSRTTRQHQKSAWTTSGAGLVSLYVV